MVMQDLARTVRLLHEIKDLGITLSIDDFGTGYSSMAMVRELPIDALKIDRSFVREIGRDAEGKAIINAIIALGRALDLIVVAEGVETKEQEAFLREQKCDEEQGYLISIPLPWLIRRAPDCGRTPPRRRSVVRPGRPGHWARAAAAGARQCPANGSAGAISLSRNCTRSSPCQRSITKEPAACTCRPRFCTSAAPSF